MRTHPDAARRDVAQQRVEIDAVAPLMNRIDPDQHAIDRGELGAHGVENIVFIDHRLGIDAKRGQRCEDGGEPAGLGSDATACRFIASPKDVPRGQGRTGSGMESSHAAAEPG